MRVAARSRQVLCPIDFSEPSRRALRYAAAFAAGVGSQLTVLYVNHPLLSTGPAAAGYDQRKLALESEREMRRFTVASVGGTINREQLRYSSATGDAPRVIARAVREFNVGLVVMGTHGLTGARKVMLGSTTERVLRDTTVPVVAVPHRAPRRPPAGWPSGPLVAGIDLGPASRQDTAAVTALARTLDSDLLLVHVTPVVDAPFWFKRHTGADDSRDRARSKLARLASDAAASDVPVSFRVLGGDPATALARVAKRIKAGALVLVLRRGKGVFGMARGTVTYRVLTTAATPVIALPAGRGSLGFVSRWFLTGVP